MDSWDAFEPVSLKPSGIVTEAFLAKEILDFRAAAAYVEQLPYGRNTPPSEVLTVIREGRGTCSTKHALLRRLALEQDLDVALVIGIYEMTESNTPGVGMILAAHSLHCLPEAHCYLRLGQRRIDVTRGLGRVQATPIMSFLYEEEIAPDQIGDYKVRLHQRFLLQWAQEDHNGMKYTVEHLWRIREQCIAALTQP